MLLFGERGPRRVRGGQTRPRRQLRRAAGRHDARAGVPRRLGRARERAPGAGPARRDARDRRADARDRAGAARGSKLSGREDEARLRYFGEIEEDLDDRLQRLIDLAIADEEEEVRQVDRQTAALTDRADRGRRGDHAPGRRLASVGAVMLLNRALARPIGRLIDGASAIGGGAARPSHRGRGPRRAGDPALGPLQPDGGAARGAAPRPCSRSRASWSAMSASARRSWRAPTAGSKDLDRLRVAVPGRRQPRAAHALDHPARRGRGDAAQPGGQPRTTIARP